jgi:predicted nucleic acid-binding Zn ribbon protein
MESAGVTVPSYDYKCHTCGVTTEYAHSIDFDGDYFCPEDNTPLSKLFAPVATHFKGGGWGGNHPKRSYRARSETVIENGKRVDHVQKVEDIGPAIKKPDTAQTK